MTRRRASLDTISNRKPQPRRHSLVTLKEEKSDSENKETPFSANSFGGRSRRCSLDFLRIRRNSKEEILSPSEVTIEQAFCDLNSRNELIDDLLQVHSQQMVMKLRLFFAILELQRIQDKNCKVRMAKKIVELFLRLDSICKVDSLPREFYDDTKIESLCSVKRFISDELLKDPLITTRLNKNPCLSVI